MEMLVLADDFTGALDTGIQFAKFGARTKVIADPDYDPAAAETDDVQVLVIDTETRHQTGKEAGQVVSAIVRRARAAGISLFYKKTDSALRGNAGAEMEALLQASGGERIHFFPAFPAMKRTVENGILYIDGIPVAESVFGRDPFDPVRCSDVRDILALQTETPVTVADDILKDGRGILVYNTRTTDEMCGMVSRLRPDGEIMLLAGCAGLADCLGRELKSCDSAVLKKYGLGENGLLVISGSVNAVTKKQLEAARKAGFSSIHLNNSQKLSGWVHTSEGKQAAEDWQREIGKRKHFLIDTNDSPEEESAMDWGASHGMDVLQVGNAIAETLACLVHSFLDAGTKQLFLLTGGDVLFHSMREMGIRELTPLAEVQPGVILAEFIRNGSPYRILTKSGGFGAEDVLIRLAEQTERKGAE